MLNKDTQEFDNNSDKEKDTDDTEEEEMNNDKEDTTVYDKYVFAL